MIHHKRPVKETGERDLDNTRETDVIHMKMTLCLAGHFEKRTMKEAYRVQKRPVKESYIVQERSVKEAYIIQERLTSDK